jgi:DDE_Tnp_1-associated
MVSHPCPLIEVLAESPDFRSHRGKRHALAAILVLPYRARRCGARSYCAIAAWGRTYGGRLMQALDFTRQPPYAVTLHTVLRQVDREAVAATRGVGLRAYCAARLPRRAPRQGWPSMVRGRKALSQKQRIIVKNLTIRDPHLR